ncbi:MULTISPECIES: DUF928 domain-containing protein [unclassified Nodularia (in: cyanobacteria)]|uniref:DUF928 domain-containing protein n=1 Tax=unclassified Nodularia (in: cyanobacteria) TaxID=2656917 RepID=UPI001880299D|nr:MULTISPECIES: DUF928 domain-containing protein [unclassified Nodularia (in: cyanobacteria)]MBE9200512.1 DUF928 domain-containing protein [Nodularia sp. LEGE 06071]MCC2691220.1 DUF928 domain-containing protein [Nodularia sp. LEGE 04288]
MKCRYLASILSIIALLAGSPCHSAYAITFTPPIKNGAPRQASGGASRGNLFTPKADRGAPRQASGGASRGNLFTPKADRGAPRQASGGASRGSLFTPNTDRGAPRQASGGSSRVGTYHLNPSSVGAASPAALMALLPQSFYGTTVSERPTILVYLPATQAEQAVFSLKDEAGKTLHEMSISVAGKTGVMSIPLPANAPALAVGKNYQWFLALKVNGTLGPSTPYVDGWIQRIQPTGELATIMQQKDALQRATAFGKNGVWYDCVATLATLHTTEPNNATIAKQWEELLASVSLKEIVTAPLFTSAK